METIKDAPIGKAFASATRHAKNRENLLSAVGRKSRNRALQ
jgi:hypothetical protein